MQTVEVEPRSFWKTTFEVRDPDLLADIDAERQRLGGLSRMALLRLALAQFVREPAR